MPAVLTREEANLVSHEMLVEETLVRIVEHRRGLKDIELALLALAEVGPHMVPLYLVLRTIHSMICQGRLTAVKYQWRDTNGIFVLPRGSAVITPIPIRVKRTETEH